MTVFEITLTDEEARRLKEWADDNDLTVDELFNRIVNALLDRPTGRFDDIATRVLSKNEELYRRLAD